MNIRYLILLCVLAFCHTALSQTRVTTYLHHDALGSVIAASDEGGQLLWRKSYLPYGGQMEGSDGKEKVSFTGHSFDKEMGLTYMKARYYDPDVGRFLQVDPAEVLDHIESNTQMFNRYAYANNNPYKYVDPDGEDPVSGHFNSMAHWMGKQHGADPRTEQGREFYGEVGKEVASNFILVVSIVAPEVRALSVLGSAAVKMGIRTGVATKADDLIHLPHTDKFGNVISRNPKSIQDQMTLEAAQRGEGIVKIPSLSDPKFKGMQKMELETTSAGGKQSKVHYVRDPKTLQTMDFKFKKHSTD